MDLTSRRGFLKIAAAGAAGAALTPTLGLGAGKTVTLLHESSFIPPFDEYIKTTRAQQYEKETGIKVVYEVTAVGSLPTRIATITETGSGAGAVWVANGLAGTVSRIDATTNEVVERTPVGNSPTAIAFGERAVWVANADDQTVSKLDPATGHVEATIPVEVPARGIAVGGRSVWLSDPAGNAVVRLDARTKSVTRRVGVGSGPTRTTRSQGRSS